MPSVSGQTDFANALLNPELETPNGVVNPDGTPAGKRFNVYRNNVVVSLLDAMETAFPVVQKLIGAENFRNLSGVYVRQYPPTSPLLMFYGDDFPAFLDGFAPLSHLPYLGDVARLELARRSAYHSADATGNAAEVISQIAPENLMAARFEFAPAVRIVPSAYPIVSIWQFNMVEDAAKPAAVAEAALVYRPELDLEMSVMEPDVASFMSALQAGEPLGAAMAAGETESPEFDLAAAIGLLLSANIITEIID